MKLAKCLPTTWVTRLQILHLCEHLGIWFYFTTLAISESRNLPLSYQVKRNSCMQQSKYHTHTQMLYICNKNTDSCMQRLAIRGFKIQSSQHNLLKCALKNRLSYLSKKHKFRTVWHSEWHVLSHGIVLTTQRLPCKITFKIWISRCQQLSAYHKIYFASVATVINSCMHLLFFKNNLDHFSPCWSDFWKLTFVEVLVIWSKIGPISK